MMPGMIMLWYGSVATIPSGWALCDGNNGTPDLRDRFIVCASEDDSGVAKSNIMGWLLQIYDKLWHQHPFTGDGHSHDLNEGNAIENVDPDGYYAHHTSTDPASGDTDDQYHIPSFYALCFIMKLPIP